MEQKNSHDLDTKIFSDLIYDPSSINAADTKIIAGLIEKYPYAQLLKSFYTRSLIDSHSASFEKELTKAAIFSPDGAILQTIIEDPESVKSKTPRFDSGDLGIAEKAEPMPIGEENEVGESSINAYNVTEEEELTIFEDIDEAAPESAYPVKEEVEGPPFEETIVEELDEEIGNNSESEPARDSDEPDDLDLLTKQNVASADYSNQDGSSNTVLDITEEVFTPESDIAENITHNAVLDDQHKVSRYDDDKMPYSFLWWLSKTRKEHADSYQPYVSFQLDTSQNIKRNTVDQLSTQIIENIFHLQSPVDELENAPKTVPFQVKRKEDFIVEKFIREEPQIKPPKSDKLDNENKARKSAEDPNDLVSETLAHIYTDQMLFHKAIDTYKKLSLKFPEKSTYFADQIRELEKKIN